VDRLLFRKREGRESDERHTIDHVPFAGTPDWRKQRLAEAAQRHGKPFKCAGDDMPREILIDHKVFVVSDRTQ
jgi:hypothetical protein